MTLIAPANGSVHLLPVTIRCAEQSETWCQANGLGNMVVKYQAEGINISGGFLVPTEFNSAVVDLREEFGTFRRNSRVVPMSSDHMTMPRRASGVTAYSVGENSAIAELIQHGQIAEGLGHDQPHGKEAGLHDTHVHRTSRGCGD